MDFPSPAQNAPYVDFVLIRHGQTAWNEAKPVVDPAGNTVQGPLTQGSSDTPLNANGEKQAHEASEFVKSLGLEFNAVYSSPLLRAAKTAEIVAEKLGLAVQIDPDLAACAWGDCEGKTKEYARVNYGFDPKGNARYEGWKEMPTKDRWSSHTIPGAESMMDVIGRMENAFKKISANHSSGDVILLASHAENIKALSLAHKVELVEDLRKQGLFDKIDEIEAANIKNCGCYQVRYRLDDQEFTFMGEIQDLSVQAN